MRIYGLKAIGLSMMTAIGLMAFTATAQAAEELTLKSRHLAILLNSGTFLAIGTKTTASGRQLGTSILKIPAKNAEIRCENGAITEASVENEEDTKLNPEGEALTEESTSHLSAMGRGKFEFSKCKVFEEKEPSPELKACTKAFNENNGEKRGGEAAPSAKVLLLAFLHFHKSITITEILEHDDYIVRGTPLAGGTLFTKLKFGGTCTLPETVEVTGSFSAEVHQFDAGVQTASIDSAGVAGKVITKDAKTKLNFGASEAFIKGISEVELEGTGSSWGVM